MLSIFLTIFSQSTLADDADLNRVAKKIKTQIEKSIKKSKKPLEGYCDVFVDLDYTHPKNTVVKKVSTLGDNELCFIAKKTIKVGNKYAYDWPERYIRVQVVSK
ncbi:TPA: hypothetical protein ACGG73_001485 [Vibrio cholerae]|uniref:hypothetical protein n=1 Tax=Vibrio cholerae TaxID=666 RepID=UPI00034D1BC4|nr:hypothetical protein [Vibrio cholerae]HAS2379217.1 hypothetical protein [Vibrio cholerae O1]ELJ8755459.1 hypothetical protein [Vibrio cholerae]ELY5211659.1 hypothetical protein [Vibrio cholerae]KUO27756.1 hypothetical protein AVO47_11875 [Vibrio cholerae]KUO31277.1 hypothetical protein AVO48_12235 [Vibrio cholerae]